MRPDRARLSLLLGLSAAVAAAEGAVLRGVGFTSALGLAPQASAVWPYGTYHDLRWVMVYHNSWPGFALEMVAAILFRGLLGTALTALAWPAEVPRPSLRWLAGRNLVFAAIVAVILSPFAALSVAAAVLSLSWFVFGALLPVLVMAPVLQHGGMVKSWWRGLPSAKLVGWSVINFVVLTGSGGLDWDAPGWWSVPVTAVAGAANGLLWGRVVHAAVIPRRVHWRRVPVAPLLVVLVFIVPIATKSVTAGEERATETEWGPPILSRPLSSSVRHAVIVIAGHGSRYHGGMSAAGPQVVRFSYSGLNAQGQPLPYEPAATNQSIDTSAALLATQVDHLHRSTGRPVAVLGESEGALVARRYLAKLPHPAVDTVAFFSPLARAGRAYYPPSAANSGWGIATGWELRGVLAVLAIGSKSPDYPDEPFVRSLIDDAPFYRNRTLCPVPGVRTIAFLPSVTAAEVPPGSFTGITAVELPAFHGGLIGHPVAHGHLIDFLSGGSVPPHEGFDYFAIQRAAGAWQAPALAFAVNPVWHASHKDDAAFEGEACPR